MYDDLIRLRNFKLSYRLGISGVMVCLLHKLVDNNFVSETVIPLSEEGCEPRGPGVDSHMITV